MYGQLLSQLTSYVALCDGIEADTVRFLFDHYELKAELKALRYYVGVDGRESVPNCLRGDSVERLSRRLADSLGQMPALQTRLAECHSVNTVRHLRLVLGGSELALVPFELATIPLGWRGAGTKLALAPIVVTRELRESSRMNVVWNRPPRVLFCTACPDGFTPPPVEAHLLGLTNAVREWLDDGSETSEEGVRRVITVLENASVAAIRAHVEQASEDGRPYTYVHFLCHGCPMPEQPERFGVVLAKEHAPREPEAVDARRLSAAFLGRNCDLEPPTVVVLATCDSANQASVEVPGSSLAYELHQKGVPWVLASQLPLTYRGSATLTRVWYQGLFDGRDPRIVLHNIRQELSSDDNSHDWASLVAYAALPSNFDAQVRRFGIERLKALIDGAFARVANLGAEKSAQRDQEFARIDRHLVRWRQAIHELGASDPAWVDYYGKEGAVAKQKASFLSGERSIEADAQLAKAMQSYRAAASCDLRSHWTVTQYLSLATLLGVPRPEGWRELARASAQLDQAKSDREAVWALGTLIELAVLGGSELATNAASTKLGNDADVALVDAYPPRAVNGATQGGCETSSVGLGRGSCHPTRSHGTSLDDDIIDLCRRFADIIQKEPSKLRFELFSTCRQLLRYTVGQFAHKAAQIKGLRERSQLALGQLVPLLDREHRTVLGL